MSSASEPHTCEIHGTCTPIARREGSGKLHIAEWFLLSQLLDQKLAKPHGYEYHYCLPHYVLLLCILAGFIIVFITCHPLIRSEKIVDQSAMQTLSLLELVKGLAIRETMTY